MTSIASSSMKAASRSLTVCQRQSRQDATSWFRSYHLRRSFSCAAPRPNNAPNRCILRTTSQTPQQHCSRYSTTTAPTTSPIAEEIPAPSINAQNPPQSSPSSTSQTKAKQHAYFVERSASGNLPVYSDYKGNGTLIQTLIRKIHGDAPRLQKDLIKALNLDPKHIKITQPAGHVVIKGVYNRPVMEFLKDKGF